MHTPATRGLDSDWRWRCSGSGVCESRAHGGTSSQCVISSWVSMGPTSHGTGNSVGRVWAWLRFRVGRVLVPQIRISTAWHVLLERIKGYGGTLGCEGNPKEMRIQRINVELPMTATYPGWNEEQPRSSFDPFGLPTGDHLCHVQPRLPGLG